MGKNPHSRTLSPGRAGIRLLAWWIVWGKEVGRTVGHREHLDERAGPATRIAGVTKGILTRRLRKDPFLEGWAWQSGGFLAGYPEVEKERQGRRSKRHRPEDPLTAQPTSYAK